MPDAQPVREGSGARLPLQGARGNACLHHRDHYVASCDNTWPHRKGRYVAFCDRGVLFSLLFTVFFLPIYNVYASIGLGFSVFFLLLKLSFSWKDRTASPLHLPIGVFCAVSALSLLVSSDKSETLIGLRKLSLHVFLYFAAVNSITDKKRLGWVLRILIFSCFIVSLDGFYQCGRGEDWFSARALMRYPNRGVNRITASFQQAGSLGIHLGAVVPVLTAFLLYFFRGIRRLAASAVLIAILGALILTLAPGAAVGFATAMLMFAVLKKERRFLIVIFLIGGLAAGALFLPASITRWPDGSLFETFLGRLQMWTIALRMIKARPWLGVGLHNFPQQYKTLCLPGYPFCEREGAPYAHNLYLHLASETGLLGLFAFFWILYLVFHHLKKIRQDGVDKTLEIISLGLTGGLAAYLTHGLFESCLQTSQGALLFWFLLGLAASVSRIALTPKKH